MIITATIDDAAIRNRLQELADRLGDLTPVMKAIGNYYTEQVQQNFEAQRSPDGTPWKPLSAATLMLGLGKPTARKRKDGTVVTRGFLKTGALSKGGKKYLQGKKILIESGDLMESVHADPHQSYVIIGTGGQIKYAAIHQFGGPAGRKSKQFTMPARPFLAVNQGTNLVLAEKDRQKILEVLEEELSKLL